jgi:hypothetical protein
LFGATHRCGPNSLKAHTFSTAPPEIPFTSAFVEFRDHVAIFYIHQ